MERTLHFLMIRKPHDAKNFDEPTGGEPMTLNQKKGLMIALALFFILGPIRCASVKQNHDPSNESFAAYQTSHGQHIAIVPMDAEPHIVCVAFDKGRGRAAAKRAGELGKKAAIGGLQLPFYMLFECRDPLEGAVVLVALPVLVPACGLGGAIIGTSAGAIGGAVKGDYIEKPMIRTEELAGFADKAASMKGFNVNLAENITKAGHNLTDNTFTITNQGDGRDDFDAILRVGMARLIFRGELERDPDIGFEAVINIEMLDASQHLLYANTYDYTSGDFNLSKWQTQDGLPLQAQFDRLYQKISEKVIEDLFVPNKRSSKDRLH
jgi:hypothetical protein